MAGTRSALSFVDYPKWLYLCGGRGRHLAINKAGGQFILQVVLNKVTFGYYWSIKSNLWNSCTLLGTQLRLFF